jgi:hypothetical protein
VENFPTSFAKSTEKNQGSHFDLHRVESVEGEEPAYLPGSLLDTATSLSSDEGGDGPEAAGLRFPQGARSALVFSLLLILLPRVQSLLSLLCNKTYVTPNFLLLLK